MAAAESFRDRFALYLASHAACDRMLNLLSISGWNKHALATYWTWHLDGFTLAHIATDFWLKGVPNAEAIQVSFEASPSTR
jgi:hypothetical protein